LRHDEFNDRSSVDRDAIERQSFDKPAWSDVNPCNLGIGELRRKLKEELFKSVTEELPSLIGEMQDQLGRRKSTLDKLGPERTTPAELRAYLSNVMYKLRRLIETALDGHYDKDEFTSFFDGEPVKFLRDQINREIENFASRLRTEGQQYNIFLGNDLGVDNTERSKYLRPLVEHILE
jgi:hypothetical protein